MDGSKANMLLNGGPDGIQEWNQRREAGEEIPDLEGVDLSDADLRGANLGSVRRAPPASNEVMKLKNANLRKANLRQANLSGAFMLGAKLQDADLSDATLDKVNLTNANLEGTVLRGATLRGAILLRAKVADATLRDADLQDADLREVEGFFGYQLAGSVVAGTKLPDDIKSFDALKTIELACSNARTIFLTMLLGCAYTVLTIGTTTDARILTNSASSPLPIIGTQIPIVGFYVFAPPLLFGFYLYFHMCMANIWKRLGTLPSVLPDGRHLDKAADPWLLLGLVQSHFARLREERAFLDHVQAIVSIFLAWYVVPLTLFLLWGRYLRAGDLIVTAIHILLFVAAMPVGIYTYRRGVSALATGKAPAFTIKGALCGLRCASVVFTLAAFLFCAATTFGARQGWFWNADIENADVSTRPNNWTGVPSKEAIEIRQVKPAKLKGANLRNLHGRGAFLVRAELQRADLRRADLSGADLREANLHGANLSDADLTNTKLTKEQISDACLDSSTKLSPIEGFCLSDYKAPTICTELWRFGEQS
jgi:uncharacterized protein YjbI with pentapeptide repeats